ncbi:GNAT family N-acetyltransferase [Erwinia sp. S43]|uniref:GNAT family N-acetyltransferase n=1 Tax=Erwinia sp. S43 TaxID=2769339 RepID=UPI00190BB937|nr:GNAT family N-acetyltransferase [Erwinia sp. S43]MBK0032770.1 GNAT family N-acetyltransferase [Erwinia sp. S43]
MEIVPLRQQPERSLEIAQLLHSEWSALQNWSSIARINERLLLRNHPDRSSFTLLADHADGSLMGTASVIEYELDDDPSRRFWLGEVFTPVAWRGKGVGSALVNACIQYARNDRMDSLWLYTPDKQSLYQRLGWREIEQREVSGEWVSVIVLNLAA